MNTPLALIGPYTAFGLAFGTYIMKGFFEGLPRELEEAARIDGAGEFRIFWQIMLPLTRPALATISIFLFLQNWNEFLFALTFITEGAMRTLPTASTPCSPASSTATTRSWRLRWCCSRCRSWSSTSSSSSSSSRG